MIIEKTEVGENSKLIESNGFKRKSIRLERMAKFKTWRYCKNRVEPRIASRRLYSAQPKQSGLLLCNYC